MYKLDNQQYPKEHYLPLENNPNHLGRVIIHKMKQSFSVEVDIIVEESHKIFYHVDSLYDFREEEDALYTAVQKLAHFLQKKGASLGKPH